MTDAVQKYTPDNSLDRAKHFLEGIGNLNDADRRIAYAHVLATIAIADVLRMALARELRLDVNDPYLRDDLRDRTAEQIKALTGEDV